MQKPSQTDAPYEGDTSELYDFPPKELMILSVNWADRNRFISRGMQSINKVVSAFERVTKSPINKNQKVLEWGCGCGRMTRHLLGRGYDVYGVDINTDAITWAKKNLDETRFSTCNTSASLHFKDNEFDFIYAGSVITHIDIPGQFEWMRELHRILKPGGHLLLTFAGTYHFRNYIDKNRAILMALNESPYVLAGEGEFSNEFGVAQTISTLDTLLFDFERKLHFQADDILGAQDTAVFKKLGNIVHSQTSAHTHTACLLYGKEFVPRETVVSIENLGDITIQGGIPKNYYLVQHELPSSPSQEFSVISPKKIISITSHFSYQQIS